MTDSPTPGLSTSRATGAGARTSTNTTRAPREQPDLLLSAPNSVRRPALASRTSGRCAVDPAGSILDPNASPRRA